MPIVEINPSRTHVMFRDLGLKLRVLPIKDLTMGIYPPSNSAYKKSASFIVGGHEVTSLCWVEVAKGLGLSYPNEYKEYLDI